MNYPTFFTNSILIDKFPIIKSLDIITVSELSYQDAPRFSGPKAHQAQKRNHKK